MIGLALMAAKRAARTTGNRGAFNMDGGFRPARREFAANHARQVPCSAEYYKIIDRISRGEKP